LEFMALSLVLTALVGGEPRSRISLAVGKTKNPPPICSAVGFRKKSGLLKHHELIPGPPLRLWTAIAQTRTNDWCIAHIGRDAGRLLALMVVGRFILRATW
jgi:hypothetical protein